MPLSIPLMLLDLSDWLHRTGWAKLERLALVVAVCVVFLWAIKLVGKAVRRAVAAAWEIQSSSARSDAAWLDPFPPATINVSIAGSAEARLACGTTVRPLEVCSGRPSTLSSFTSYPRSRRPVASISRWAPANTSNGPAKSRLCTPG